MNGGFALKLACERERVLEALAQIAAEEQLALVAASGDELAEEDPGFLIGVGVRAPGTIVVPANHGVGDTALLETLGAALAARLGCPTSYVVDSDEGRDVLRGWNGGETMSPDTGWATWDGEGHRCFALVGPRHRVLDESEARVLIPELERALPTTVKEIGARIVAVARRDAHGPLGRAVTSWCITVAIPEYPPVPVILTLLPGGDLVRCVRWEVPQRLDRHELATRMREAPPRVRDAVAARIEGALESLEYEGFGVVIWHARVSIDGEVATLPCETSLPSETAEQELDDIVQAISVAIEYERESRFEATRAALEDSLDEQLERGDLDAAATTYRALYEEYFSDVDEDDAIAASQEKVRELLKLYAPK